MLKGLPIDLVQAGSSIHQIKSDKLFILCINQNKLLEEYIIT